MASSGGATRGFRAEKVRRIFERFDRNGDGGLDREEMAALVVAVNPRVKFSDEQINAILDEVFRTYADFIHPDHGLTVDGLIRTYDDGAGDVERDFEALSLDLSSPTDSIDKTTTSIVGESASPEKQQQPRRTTTSPTHQSIVYEETRRLVDDLEILVKRLRNKQAKKDTAKQKGGDNSVESSDAGWSRELDTSERKNVFWEESGSDYVAFSKELAALRSRADNSRSLDESFDGHMAMGRTLYDHHLFKDSLVSFVRACDLQPTDPRPHFRSGNSHYAVGDHSQAKEKFLLSLDAAGSDHHWAYLLPQIHINLGISLEADGMLLGACEHYREAAILCPSHFRALKLLGCALLGVGEYRASVKALEEAVFLKPDYVDAHCDLGSALHALGDDDKAIQSFQKAIDLKPGHVDALYNLGGLSMDAGRFPRASEMYTRVLAISPNHWRAQLNKAVALLAAGENEDSRKAFREALKMTRRVEVYDAIAHLKALQKKKKKQKKEKNLPKDAPTAGYQTIDTSKFAKTGPKTTSRQELTVAMAIRAFQRITRLNRCDVDVLKRHLAETNVPISYSGGGTPHKSIRKAELEVILRKMLSSLSPEAFQGSVKAVNEKILSVLDESGLGRVDFCLFLAILAPICAGSLEKRKRMAYDALLQKPGGGAAAQVRRADVLSYIKMLRAVYIPSHGSSNMMEFHGESDPSLVSYTEFLEMFNDPDWGFGIITTLAKLEAGDRIRHGRFTCSVCRYPIIGSRFKEINRNFHLCNFCYSEGKVPSDVKSEEYKFKEYGTEAEAIKDKCACFSLHSKTSTPSSK